MNKTCLWCSLVKDEKDFYKKKAHCIQCHKKYNRERKEAIEDGTWSPKNNGNLKFGSSASGRRRKRKREVLDIKQFITNVYNSMVSRTSGYGRSFYAGLDICSRGEFEAWAIGRGDLFDLYHKWNRKYFARKYRPTIDRIDSSKGYVLGNMRWLTLSRNSSLGSKKATALKKMEVI